MALPKDQLFELLTQLGHADLYDTFKALRIGYVQLSKFTYREMFELGVLPGVAKDIEQHFIRRSTPLPKVFDLKLSPERLALGPSSFRLRELLPIINNLNEHVGWMYQGMPATRYQAYVKYLMDNEVGPTKRFLNGELTHIHFNNMEALWRLLHTKKVDLIVIAKELELPEIGADIAAQTIRNLLGIPLTIREDAGGVPY